MGKQEAVKAVGPLARMSDQEVSEEAMARARALAHGRRSGWCVGRQALSTWSERIGTRDRLVGGMVGALVEMARRGLPRAAVAKRMACSETELFIYAKPAQCRQLVQSGVVSWRCDTALVGAVADIAKKVGVGQERTIRHVAMMAILGAGFTGRPWSNWKDSAQPALLMARATPEGRRHIEEGVEAALEWMRRPRSQPSLAWAGAADRIEPVAHALGLEPRAASALAEAAGRCAAVVESELKAAHWHRAALAAVAVDDESILAGIMGLALAEGHDVARLRGDQARLSGLVTRKPHAWEMIPAKLLLEQAVESGASRCALALAKTAEGSGWWVQDAQGCLREAAKMAQSGSADGLAVFQAVALAAARSLEGSDKLDGKDAAKRREAAAQMAEDMANKALGLGEKRAKKGGAGPGKNSDGVRRRKAMAERALMASAGELLAWARGEEGGANQKRAPSRNRL